MNKILFKLFIVKKRNWIFWIGICVLFLTACTGRKKNDIPVLFDVLDNTKTGLDFSNNLSASPDFNMLKYMYFYNGAGVGAGDFNNDGRIDLFFASNQSQNKIYLNKGDLQFTDVTTAAKIPDDGGWSTGVSIADVNDDGLLDIYVCRVGHFESLQSRNQLLICKGISDTGIPYYNDEAQKYGVDFSGFSTQAAFFDFDLDGDLDMYLLNHSLRYSSTFAPRDSFKETIDSLSGDRFFRNDGNHFTDISKTAGINQTVIGYGLGIAVSDINLDGYPDIYIGNDFHENDYLYINNKKGGFDDLLDSSIMHTSQFSMGVDVADITNDGYPEIISADMLPSDPVILKSSLGVDEYNTFLTKIRNGYNFQYARNALQLNRRNGLFSEIGLYAGVYATDWSWSTLWLDFDNDGLKDLFVSNGIPKRLNDIDYINYISNEEVQSKIQSNKIGEREMNLINKFPQIKIPNRFFRNKGNASFDDISEAIPENKDTYSNGAVYADLDNDGDIDIVVNNIDEPALVYQNKINDDKKNPAIQIVLKGPVGNNQAVGAKLYIFSGTSVISYEKFPVRGFQSSMEVPMQVSTGSGKPDSVFLVWPDNTTQRINLSSGSLQQKFAYTKGLPLFDYSLVRDFSTKESAKFYDVTAQANISFLHMENTFVEFDREPLIPFMTSTEGPALATGDINKDGLEDFFIGSSKWEKSAVFEQLPDGTFKKLPQPAVDADSTYEDVDACWTDVNNDSYPDLVVASGGNEFYGQSEYLKPRVYINNGKGILKKKEDAFSNVLLTASKVVANDFNEDGFTDLFIGGRSVSWEYGKVPDSYLLQNDGTGKFIDVTDKFAPGLKEAGFIKDANWVDLNKDGRKDLVLAMEWDGISVYLNSKNFFSRKYITSLKGWWNFILPCDIDNDGDIDFIAGNQGLNSRLMASEQQPVRMYFYDFDGNGKKEQVLTYYLDNKELPFTSISDLEKQLPVLKKKFLYAKDFANASLKEIFGADKLRKADIFSAHYFSNAVLINDGKMNFEVLPLPWEAQLTAYKTATILDINNDTLPDILLGGNFYSNNIQLGRYDADFGSVLINRGKGNFKYEELNGIEIKAEIRHLQRIRLATNVDAFIVAKNNDNLTMISTKY